LVEPGKWRIIMKIETEPESCKNCNVGLYDRESERPDICELAKDGSCFVLDPISAKKNMEDSNANTKTKQERK
jgi:hypothetical protein